MNPLPKSIRLPFRVPTGPFPDPDPDNARLKEMFPEHFSHATKT